MRLSLDFPLLGVLLGALGWLRATLGPPLGRPWATLGVQAMHLGRLGASPGPPRRSLGSLQGISGHPSGLPWACRLGSGRVLCPKTIKNDMIFVDVSIIFGNEFDGRCCWFTVGFCFFFKVFVLILLHAFLAMARWRNWASAP